MTGLLARLESRDSQWWATVAHYVSLALAFVILCWITRDQWFNVDEWAFLVDRGSGTDDLGWLEPHNEHWSTLAIAGYRVLFEIFGVRTYFPYLAVLFAFHLVIAHLLWRVLRRIGIDPWFATVAVALFAVLGVGWENLTSAFQWQLIGTLCSGFAAVLLAPVSGPFRRRDVGVALLLVLGLMFSGVGLSMVAVVTIVLVLRTRYLAAVAAVAIPGLVYGAWFLAYGRDAADAPLQEPLTEAIQDMPAFVWEGLTGAVDGATGLAGVGVVTIALLVLWTIRKRDAVTEPTPIWLAMAAGAAFFLAVTTIRRSGLGIETASSSRYAYIVVALLTPAIAIALDPLLRRGTLGRGALVLGGLALLLVQLSTLNTEAQATAAREQEQKRRIVATAELADAGIDVISPAPVPDYIPNLTFDEIVVLDRDGDLPSGVRVDDADRLTARTYLQVAFGEQPLVDIESPPVLVAARGAATTPGTRSDCTLVVPESPVPVLVLDLDGDAAIQLHRSVAGTLEVRLADGDAVGRPRSFMIPGEARRTLSVTGAPVELRLTLPAIGSTEICGIDELSTPGDSTTDG